MNEREFRRRIVPLQRLMYGTALRIGLCPEDAADTVQETLIKLWRFREGIPEDDAGTRLYCMEALRRESITTLRKQKPKVPLDQVSGIRTPEDRSSAEYRDTRRWIETLIDSLPPDQAKVVRLGSFGGLDNAEIAEVTGLSPANVRQLLSRGRRRLKEMINRKNIPHDNGQG